MCRLFMFFTSFLICLNGLFAQDINGRVLDFKTKTPIESVVVQIIKDGEPHGFSISDSKGFFKLSIKDIKAPFIISLENMIYQKRIISSKMFFSSKKHIFYLKEKQVKLDEVTVSAPAIRQLGDTIKYRLGAYASKRDINLEDAIKKLPGIQVSKTGNISYLGKNIDKFTIEGMDLVDGRYKIATQNLSKDAVGSVEIMENQQDIKQLKGIVHDNQLVMNIVLNKKGKNRINGRLDLGSGYEKDNTLAYAGTTSMLFKKNTQIIGTAAYNKSFKEKPQDNIRFIGKDISDYFPLNSVLNSNMGNRPNISEKQYLYREDFTANLNFIHRFKDKSSLRVFAGYSDQHEDNSYNTIRRYFSTNSKDVNIFEDINPTNREKIPEANIEYIKNTKSIFINDKLVFKGNNSDLDYNLNSNKKSIRQISNNESFSFANLFSMVKYFDNTILNTSSKIQMSKYPSRSLSVDGNNQEFSGNTYYGDLSVSSSWKIAKNLRFSLPSTISAKQDELDLTSSWDTKLFSEKNKSKLLNININPRLEWAKIGFYSFVLNLRSEYNHLNIEKINTNKNDNFNKTFFNPSMVVYYSFSSRLRLNMTAFVNNEIGNISNFISSPIFQDYRNKLIMPNILSQNSSYGSNIDFNFRYPLQEMFARINAGYTNLKSNLILNDKPLISSNEISYSEKDNRSITFNIGGNISKYFRFIKTKLSLSGNYSYSKNEVFRNNILTPFKAKIISYSTELRSDPLKWLEFAYLFRGSNSLLIPDEGKSSNLFSFYQSAELKASPIEGWDIYANIENINKEIIDDNRSKIWLMGLGSKYKYNKFHFTLDIDNIFNQHNYSYAIFNGLNLYEMKYSLRGISFKLGVSYYF